MASARQARLPFTVSLLVAGFLLGQIVTRAPAGISSYLAPTVAPEVFLFLFLPALIFEPAFQLNLRQLRSDLIPVLALAIPGVLLTATSIGLVIWWISPFNLGVSLLLGAILSATDPVAVVALYRRLGVPPRITMVIEGESLLGGVAAIVIALLLMATIATGVMDADAVWRGIADFFLFAAGGALIGWLAALLWGWLLAMWEGDPFIETALATVLAYASFLIAEVGFGVSGVSATLAAGLTLGAWGRTKISAEVEAYLGKFWDFAAAAAALLFLLLGLRVEWAALASSWEMILAAIVAMLVARAGAVYLLVPLVGGIARAEPMDRNALAAVAWGGLRGAIAAALVLSLGAQPFSAVFVVVVTGVILFSVLGQGLTLEKLARALGLERRSLADRIGRDEGLRTALRRAGRETPELKRGTHFSARLGDGPGAGPDQDLRRLRDELGELARTELESDQERSLLLMRCFAAERAFYDDLFAKAHLSERAYRNCAIR